MESDHEVIIVARASLRRFDVQAKVSLYVSVVSVLGMLVGMIWFPPFGLILGALAGALLGEFLVGKSEKEALRAAWGVFVGTMLGIGLKLIVSLAITIYFVVELV